jgi:hypothetical protein
MVGLGLIVLGGVVVNNGIVLVEFINELRRKGMPLEEAVVEASRIRLRPILLTAGTTILGLLPLTLGLQPGAELQIPMGTTMIWGLTISTFLTLICLPTIYAIGAGFFEKLKGLFWKTVSPPTPLAAAELGWVAAGSDIPLESVTRGSTGSPRTESPSELPEIPQDFGNEEAVTEKVDLSSILPAAALSMPEPPEVSVFSEPKPEEGPPPTLADPLFEGSEPSGILPPPLPPVFPFSPPPAAPPGSLNPRQQQLMAYLGTHGRISRKEYVDLTGVSVPTAARDLKELVDRSLIQGIGPPAKGRYYVLNPPVNP